MSTGIKLREHFAFQLLDSLGLNPDEYIIMSSGIMFGLGIRPLEDLHDLDLFVNNSGWEKVKKIGEVRHDEVYGGDYVVLFDGLIEIFNTWGPGDYIFEDLQSSVTSIDGYSFLCIEKAIEWKRLKGREKDLEHIKMMEEYLRKQK